MKEEQEKRKRKRKRNKRRKRRGRETEEIEEGRRYGEEKDVKKNRMKTERQKKE